MSNVTRLPVGERKLFPVGRFPVYVTTTGQLRVFVERRVAEQYRIDNYITMAVDDDLQTIRVKHAYRGDPGAIATEISSRYGIRLPMSTAGANKFVPVNNTKRERSRERFQHLWNNERQEMIIELPEGFLVRQARQRKRTARITLARLSKADREKLREEVLRDLRKRLR